ncbi:MAG: hypothetical protein WCF30_11850 [Terracidiphilus sp.]
MGTNGNADTSTNINDSKHSPDSEGLGFYRNGRMTVGYVDEVNGPGAVEMPGVVATKHELVQLVKYWASIRIDIRFDWFANQCVGSSESRLESFSGRRIARIAEVLGNDETSGAVQQAYAEYAKNIDPRIWNVFLNGTPEEQSALQEEIEREMLSKGTSGVKPNARL